MERFATFHDYYIRGNYDDDIHRTETPDTTAGMGGGNSGLQKQRNVSQAVVQGERNHANYILSLGTRDIVCCQFNEEAA